MDKVAKNLCGGEKIGHLCTGELLEVYNTYNAEVICESGFGIVRLGFILSLTLA